MPPHPPTDTAPPATGQQQASLPELDAGLRLNARDVERQGAAYTYFRGVYDRLQQIQAEPGLWDSSPPGERPRLPFISFTFPTEGETPGEYKLDLNTLSGPELGEFAPLFLRAWMHTGELYMQAWKNVQNITAGAMQIVERAEQQQGGG